MGWWQNVVLSPEKCLNQIYTTYSLFKYLLVGIYLPFFVFAFGAHTRGLKRDKLFKSFIHYYSCDSTHNYSSL